MTMTAPPPRIALTMGDPAGIGPEICLRTIANLRCQLAEGTIELLLVGSAAALAQTEVLLGGTYRIGESVCGLKFVEVSDDRAPYVYGRLCKRAGDMAFRSTKVSVEMVQAGRADAIATAPLNKEALYLAGHHYAGYTEMLSHLTGSEQAVMMLAHGNLRVSHVTTHVPLRKVPDLVTPERLERVVRLTHEVLLAFGVQRPAIAIAALNPHAGEGGNFGTEDDTVVRPLIARLRAGGLDVSGPVPGDTVFVKAVAGQYDAVVAMYHDQGHVPIKLLGFKISPETGVLETMSGTNITLGLPVIRTSVDHGTAFDIAGQGIANESSLTEAIEVAARLVSVKRRQPEFSNVPKVT